MLPDSESVGSDALHALFHKLSTQYKGFGWLAMMAQPKSDRLSSPFRHHFPETARPLACGPELDYQTVIASDKIYLTL